MPVSSGFPGFPAEGLRFLRSLKRHNDREWFQPRKQIYEESLKAPMLQMLDAINRELIDLAPLHVTEPAKGMLRIYRDTRFSPDKTPYKTQISAVLPRRGMAKHTAAYYLSISPEKVDIGGGVYHTDPANLRAIRQHIAQHHAEFRRTFESRSVRALMGELECEQLTRVPKGFAADHPAAPLLRFKDYFLLTELEPAIATTPALLGEIVKRFRAITPFINFLNEAVARPKSAGKSIL